MSCSAVVPWVLGSHTLGAQELYPGCSGGVLRSHTLGALESYPGCSEVVPWVLGSCTLGARESYPGCSGVIPWVLRSHTLGAWVSYPGCSGVVPWVLRSHTLGARESYPGCSEVVPWVLVGSTLQLQLQMEVGRQCRTCGRRISFSFSFLAWALHPLQFLPWTYCPIALFLLHSHSQTKETPRAQSDVTLIEAHPSSRTRGPGPPHPSSDNCKF